MISPKHFVFLTQAYRNTLKAPGEEETGQVCDSKIDATINLLEHTSNFVRLFNDNLEIRSTDDPRMRELDDFLRFIRNWKASCNTDKEFISSKLFFDLQCNILGLKALVDFKLHKFPGKSIKLAIVNQDAVENHFC